jgi:hypothetical protein
MLALLVVAACGPVAVDDEGAQLSLDQGISRPSRLVHWQVNSDWPEAGTSGYQVPSNVFRQAKTYDAVPDVFALQECGRACACGDTKAWNPDTASCDAPAGSAPRVAQTVTGERYDFVVSSWANTVMWRSARFTKHGFFMWNATDADPTYRVCAKPSDPGGNEAMNIAVRLTDTRGTSDPSDDREVVVASMHVGDIPACTARLLKYFDRTVRASWGEPAWVFISGDWNMTVDTTSSTAAGRRAELLPDCWYQLVSGAIDAPSSCGNDFGGYFDAAKVRHGGEGICSQYTFPNPGSHRTADDLRCDSARALTRIDYTLIRGAAAQADKILKVVTDRGYYDANGNGDVDFGEIYAGHRAVRTLVEY